MQNKYKSLRNTEKYVVNRDFDRAIREYKRLLETDGEDPAILNTLGDLLLRNNRKEEALGSFRRVAEIYEESGFIAKAIAVCNKIAKLNSGERATLQKLVDLNKRRGHRFEAARFLGQLVQERRDAGDLSEAISYQKQILEINPSNPESNLQTARLLSEAGKTEDSTQYLVSAGRAFLAKGRAKEALESGKEALTTNSNSREAQLLLADAERIFEVEEGIHSAPHDIEDFEAGESALSEEAETEAKVEEISELDFSDFSFDEPEKTEINIETPIQETEEKVHDFDFSVEPITAQLDEDASLEVDLEKFDTVEVPDVEEQQELNSLADQVEEAEEIAGQVEEAEVEEAEEDSEPEEELEVLEVEELLPVEEPAQKPFKDRLDEADFYLKLDLKEDARRTIDGLLTDFPENEEVLSRLETLEGDASESSEKPQSETDFEIETALDDLFDSSNLEQDSFSVPTSGDAPPLSSASEIVSDNPKPQFDLGIAYREMGMFEDAIAKFEEAFSSYEVQGNEEESVRCSSLLAATYLQLGNYRDTIQWADRGLGLSEIKSFERKTLEFDRAQAFELLGEFDQSLKSYRKVFEEDPDFRDVQARISKIELLSD